MIRNTRPPVCLESALAGIFPVCLLALMVFSAANPLAASDSSVSPAPDWKLHGSTEVRAAMIFAVGAFRLYTDLESHPTRETPLLDGRTALAIHVTYHRTIRTARLISVAEKALAAQFSEAERAPFRNALEAINAAYQDVEANDSYRIEFTPDNGLALLRNGSIVHHDPDPAFGLHYLHIWLGTHDTARKLKSNLLRRN
jgi:hypothetical protein